MALKEFKKEGNTVEMEIVISAENFEKAVESAYKRNVSKMNVPGFRRGKAPRKIIEKMYGAEVFHDEALDALFPIEYDNAVNEIGVTPVDRPIAESMENEEEGYKIKVKVTVKPEASIENYKNIEVEKPIVTVSESDVEKELEGYQKRQSRQIDIEDGKTINGDKVKFDFEGFVDGEPFEGGKAEKYELVLGSGQFIPGFEDQMIGKKAGDEFSVNVKFPDEYHAENLKGKDAEFKIKLHEIKREELPEIDDEFAKDVSDFDTLAEFKADLEKKILERKENQAENTLVTNIENKIAELVVVDIPECMITAEIDSTINNFKQRLKSQRMEFEMYLQYTGQTEEAMRDSLRPNAERDLKIRLALEKITALEGIIIDSAEIDEIYKKFSDEMKIEVEKIVNDYATENITKDLSLKKAFELVKNNAVVKEVDFQENNDDITDEDFGDEVKIEEIFADENSENE